MRNRPRGKACLSIGAFLLASLDLANGTNSFPADGGQANTITPLQEFRRARSDGVSAYQTGNFAKAETIFLAAAAIYPTHPGILILLARAAVQTKQIDVALQTLQRYSSFGFTLDLDKDIVLKQLIGVPRFGLIEKRLKQNAEPVGATVRVFEAPNEPLLVEKIAFDQSGKLLIGAVHRAGVYRVSDGRLGLFSPPGALTGIFGMQTDPARNDLWVVTAAAPQVDNPAYPEPAIVRLDLTTGGLKERIPLKVPGAHQWGDVVVATDGTVYASDGLSGQIWRLEPSSHELKLFVDSGSIGSPQGMLVTPDQRRLIVADYSTGLHSIDRETGADTPLPLPSSLSLIGTDSLVANGAGKIYAVQNGVTPQRLLELTLDANWTHVERSRVLVANLSELDEPTGAVIRGGDLYFVASSQWSEFDDKGALITVHGRTALVDEVGISAR
jgi:hypothetical protein